MSFLKLQAKSSEGIPNDSSESLRDYKLKAKKGFSFVEVLIALAILGAFTAIASIRLSSISDRIAVESFAQKVAADLERCQVSAQNSGLYTALNFSSNTYSIVQNGDNIDYYCYSSKIFRTGAENFEFRSDGSLTSANASEEVVLSNDTFSKTVRVYSESGAVIVE